MKIAKNVQNTYLIYKQSNDNIIIVSKYEKIYCKKVENLVKYTFLFILSQGVYRQIRRLCEACGAKVRSLKRIRVMNIRLGDLKPGEWREVTGEELETLLTDTGMLNRK